MVRSLQIHLCISCIASLMQVDPTGAVAGSMTPNDPRRPATARQNYGDSRIRVHRARRARDPSIESAGQIGSSRNFRTVEIC